MSIREYTLSEIAEKIRNKEISCETVVKECLEQCKQFADYNAFITLFEEQSIAVAKAYDEMLDADYVVGPLHGVPIVLKDNIYLKGSRTTGGSKILGDFIPGYDATVAARLKSAGAIILGKTNMHEFAYGGTTENIHYGIAHNPWDFKRNPAGSSGGTGASVAARCAFGGLGTDTGGSIRLPASVNNLVGLRPTIGRVSNYGIIPLAYSEDTCGPITRTVEDCALMLNVMAGHDYHDKNSSKVETEDYTKDLNRGIFGLRIGIIKDYCTQHNQPDVEVRYDEAIQKFKEMGAVVREVELPDLDLLISAQTVVDAVEPAAYHLDWMRNQPEDYGEDVRLELEMSMMFGGTQYVQSLAYRSLLKSAIEDVFKDVDVIVTPTLPYTAPEIGKPVIDLPGGFSQDALAAIWHYTAIASITGKPALSVPAGFDSAGLPVGITIMGDSFAESLLFRVGYAYQNETEFFKKAPKIANIDNLM